MTSGILLVVPLDSVVNLRQKADHHRHKGPQRFTELRRTFGWYWCSLVVARASCAWFHGRDAGATFPNCISTHLALRLATIFKSS